MICKCTTLKRLKLKERQKIRKLVDRVFSRLSKSIKIIQGKRDWISYSSPPNPIHIIRLIFCNTCCHKPIIAALILPKMPLLDCVTQYISLEKVDISLSKNFLTLRAKRGGAKFWYILFFFLILFIKLPCFRVKFMSRIYMYHDYENFS